MDDPERKEEPSLYSLDPDSGGHYKLIRLLGKGGMSKVYLSIYSSLMGFKKMVAIKRISRKLSDDDLYVKSLINEARIGGQLHHQNIVEIYDLNHFQDCWYLVMEYVDGWTLDRIIEVCRKEGVSIPPSVVLGCFIEVCKGLHYAHTLVSESGDDLNIVHRDLKPGNIIISNRGQIKVLDFGIAKASCSLFNTSGVGTTKGTPVYMSPEQVRGKRNLTGRSDLFSLGPILHEMMCLKVTFGEKQLTTIAHRIVSGDIQEAVDETEDRIPGMGPVIEKLMATVPEDRFASAREVAIKLSWIRRETESKPTVAEWIEEFNGLEAAREMRRKDLEKLSLGLETPGTPLQIEKMPPPRMGKGTGSFFFGAVNEVTPGIEVTHLESSDEVEDHELGVASETPERILEAVDGSAPKEGAASSKPGVNESWIRIAFDQEDEIKKLRADVVELSAKLTQLDSRLSTHETDVAQAASVADEVENLREEQLRDRTKIGEVQKVLENVQGTLERQRPEIEKIAGQCTSTRSLSDERNDEILEAMNGGLARLDEKIDGVREGLGTNRTELEGFQQTLETIRAEMLERAARSSEYQEEIRGLERALRELEQDVAAMSEAHEEREAQPSRLEVMGESIGEIRQGQEATQEGVERLSRKVETQNEEIKVLQSEIEKRSDDDVRDRLGKNRRELEGFQQTLETIRAEMLERAARSSEHQEEIRGLERALRELEQDVAAMSRAPEEREAQASRLEAMEGSIGEIRLGQGASREGVDRLSRKVETQSEEIKVMQSVIERQSGDDVRSGRGDVKYLKHESMIAAMDFLDQGLARIDEQLEIAGPPSTRGKEDREKAQTERAALEHAGEESELLRRSLEQSILELDQILGTVARSGSQTAEHSGGLDQDGSLDWSRLLSEN